MRSDDAGVLRGDRGSVTVLGAFVVAALVGVTVLVVHLGVATAARHRAQSGADLAALAGAGRALLAEADPCGAAQTIAAANAVQITECDVEGTEVSVTAAVSLSLGPFGSRRAVARSRAGPSDIAAEVGDG